MRFKIITNIFIGGTIGALPILAGFVSRGFAAPASFLLDTPESRLTISGSVNGAPLQQQGPGSLSTTYSGNFLIDLSPKTVQFIAGGVADANTSGSWDPLPNATAGTSPADYGAQANFGILGTARFAVRNLIADGFSDSIPLSSGLTFDASLATVSLVNGEVAYRSILASGTSTLIGTGSGVASGNLGTLTIARSVPAATATATIQIPIAATVIDDIDPIGTATINFVGSFRGTVTSIVGDTNFDKSVNLDDFTALASSFGNDGSWLAGDFTGDGTVNLDDFTGLAANFGQTAPAERSSVPEP
ncbi:MAG TPA: hypothetical protein PLD59_03915, partial [Tepidisphaeraceae bacterium]|nr:hypothetical protein [Tepidisphaeraceae bacterium]